MIRLWAITCGDKTQIGKLIELVCDPQVGIENCGNFSVFHRKAATIAQPARLLTRRPICVFEIPNVYNLSNNDPQNRRFHNSLDIFTEINRTLDSEGRVNLETKPKFTGFSSDGKSNLESF